MITEDIEGGRPVSDQLPLNAASKNGDEKNNTSLCALSGRNGMIIACQDPTYHCIVTNQNVVLSTTILTVPGK